MDAEATLAARLFDALAFAAERHAQQRRKGASNTPYVNHVIEVARILAVDAENSDPEVLLAALLHDVVEDTATTPDELEQRFGPRVQAMVAELSDDKQLPKLERKRLVVAHASTLSSGAKLIKLADLCCNVRDTLDDPPLGWSQERRNQYVQWARAVVEALGDVHPRLRARFDALVELDARTQRGEVTPS